MVSTVKAQPLSQPLLPAGGASESVPSSQTIVRSGVKGVPQNAANDAGASGPAASNVSGKLAEGVAGNHVQAPPNKIVVTFSADFLKAHPHIAEKLEKGPITFTARELATALGDERSSFASAVMAHIVSNGKPKEAAWASEFVQDHPNRGVIHSQMSSFAQWFPTPPVTQLTGGKKSSAHELSIEVSSAIEDAEPTKVALKEKNVSPISNSSGQDDASAIAPGDANSALLDQLRKSKDGQDIDGVLRRLGMAIKLGDNDKRQTCLEILAKFASENGEKAAPILKGLKPPELQDVQQRIARIRAKDSPVSQAGANSSGQDDASAIAPGDANSALLDQLRKSKDGQDIDGVLRRLSMAIKVGDTDKRQICLEILANFKLENGDEAASILKRLKPPELQDVQQRMVVIARTTGELGQLCQSLGLAPAAGEMREGQARPCRSVFTDLGNYLNSAPKPGAVHNERAATHEQLSQSLSPSAVKLGNVLLSLSADNPRLSKSSLFASAPNSEVLNLKTMLALTGTVQTRFTMILEQMSTGVMKDKSGELEVFKGTASEIHKFTGDLEAQMRQGIKTLDKMISPPFYRLDKWILDRQARHDAVAFRSHLLSIQTAFADKQGPVAQLRGLGELVQRESELAATIFRQKLNVAHQIDTP